jgi:spermidine synthase
VEKAVMVDIDRELVELCREHLPEWADGAFSDPRARISIQNARSFINGSKQKYDIMISDLTEPLRTSPSLPLYTQDFFREVRAALKEDGIFAVTAGSCDPYYSRFFSSCVKTLESVFRCVRPFWTFIFSFGLPWGFILAADRADPAGLSEKEILRRSRLRKVRRLRFYHPLLHKSLFSLPIYLLQSIRSARILTDKRPFIWEA